VVFILGLALGLHFFPLTANGHGVVSEFAGISEHSSAPRNGVGGLYLEATDFTAFEERLALFAEMDEPGADASQSPRILLFETHSIQQGDLIGTLAINYGLNEDTILSVNNIRNSRLLQIGQVLRIPNQDGILSEVRADDTLQTIAERYRSDAEAIRIANQLFSDVALPGTTLFIPGGRLSWEERQEINGDLFVWPLTGRIPRVLAGAPILLAAAGASFIMALTLPPAWEPRCGLRWAVASAPRASTTCLETLS